MKALAAGLPFVVVLNKIDRGEEQVRLHKDLGCCSLPCALPCALPCCAAVLLPLCLIL